MALYPHFIVSALVSSGAIPTLGVLAVDDSPYPLEAGASTREL